MFLSRRVVHRALALATITLAAASCRPRAQGPVSDALAPAPTRTADEDGPSHAGLVARVVCESDVIEATTWSNIEVRGRDEDSNHLCEAALREATCPAGARRVVRACGADGLGPAPRVPHGAAVLRHTMSANSFRMLLDDVEAHRTPSGSRGSVHKHVVVSTIDTCDALRAELTQRARERADEYERLWNEGMVKSYESDLRKTREELTALERPLGRPVAEHIADLRSKLPRVRSEAERKRIESALVEANLVELMDSSLRRRQAQDEQLIEHLRAPAAPSEPVEVFTCLAPGAP
jgi:hypothetical protein